jgi:hypothetical protein
MLTRRDVLKVDGVEVVPYPSTTMDRNLLIVHVRVVIDSFTRGCSASVSSTFQAVYRGTMKIDLMTSHHESLKQGASERIRQLRLCFRKMLEAPSDRTVLFGGDLNMRDGEVRALLVTNSYLSYFLFLAQTRRWHSTRNL